jgi:hypothetical protein
VNTRVRFLAALALAALSACSKEKVCATGELLCGDACVAATDPEHCGACGTRCASGQACAHSTSQGGAPQCVECLAGDPQCATALYVACFATDQVIGVSADLGAVTAQYRVDDGPISLARAAAGLYVANGVSPPVVDLVQPGQSDPGRFVLPAAGGSSYLGLLRVRDGRIYASNPGVQTLMAIDGANGAVLQEVPVWVNPGDVANPGGFDFVGDRAYVPLSGNTWTTPDNAPSYDTSQQIAVVDFSTDPASVVKRIGLNVPNSHDTDAFPFPNSALAVGSRVYVTLANLKYGEGLEGWGSAYVVPAGNGRLAVIDTAADDALSIVDLRAQCQNPGGLAVAGTTLWVACIGATPGSEQWREVPPSIVPVDLSGPTPIVGDAIVTPSTVSGKIAFCNGVAYVGDQNSGKVLRFDPTGETAPVVADVCLPDEAAGFAYAADVACGP